MPSIPGLRARSLKVYSPWYRSMISATPPLVPQGQTLPSPGTLVVRLQRTHFLDLSHGPPSFSALLSPFLPLQPYLQDLIPLSENSHADLFPGLAPGPPALTSPSTSCLLASGLRSLTPCSPSSCSDRHRRRGAAGRAPSSPVPTTIQLYLLWPSLDYNVQLDRRATPGEAGWRSERGCTASHTLPRACTLASGLCWKGKGIFLELAQTSSVG